MRDDVKWQDSVPFTAKDVMFSSERARQAPGGVAEVVAKDDHILVIKTKVPNPDLLLNLASVHIFSKHESKTATIEGYNSGKTLVDSGPYHFKSYLPGDRLETVLNEIYWGRKPDSEAVRYRYVNNATVRTAALLAVDVIDKVSVTDHKRLKSADQLKVYV